MTKVKICGITSMTDASDAAHAGADYLGFIFYPGSPRYIAPADARDIVWHVRNHFNEGGVQFVGVFVDAPVEKMLSIRQELGLSLIQCHGHETPDMVNQLQSGAFKAIQSQDLTDSLMQVDLYAKNISHEDTAPQLLLDAFHPSKKGGTGLLADMEIAQALSLRCRLLLAGGLNPGNVYEIIRRVKPWGVDVSSGVEMNHGEKVLKGRKDPNKIRAFIQEVKRADDWTG
ncbi:MAG: phosphoribosylanthranilate isomerase [Anaerolineae bacterium]|nr:phosphoribosylanthranilate isomerase [Anaerolineae bacterium]